MSRPIVVVTRQLPSDLLAPLQEIAEVRVVDTSADPPVELAAGVAGASAIICTLNDRIDTEVLAQAGARLRVVANIAAGVDNLDRAAIRAVGAVPTNTPSVLTEATADLTIGLMLALTRRIVEGDRLIRSSEPWRWELDFMLGTSLQGKTLGIVGMGLIGRAVAGRARAFGMEIVHFSRSGSSGGAARALGMGEFLSASDVLTLHCPLTPETHHLFSTEEFRRMRPTAFLINTARGAIVDERALVSALQEGEIAGAALDVFEYEPAVTKGLRELPNVVVTPHLGSATQEARRKMIELAVANARAVLCGEAALSPVP